MRSVGIPHIPLLRLPVSPFTRPSFLSDFSYESELNLNLTTLERFTTIVTDDGLEKAEPILNQVPRDGRLYSPPKDAV